VRSEEGYGKSQVEAARAASRHSRYKVKSKGDGAGRTPALPTSKAPVTSGGCAPPVQRPTSKPRSGNIFLELLRPGGGIC